MSRFFLATILLLSGLLGCREPAVPNPAFVDDRAGLLTVGERERLEAYHQRLLEDLEIHLHVTILAKPAANIDALAVQLVEDHGLGRTTSAARGVLLLVDPQGEQVRLEIGYDLEGIFTDLLVSRVEEQQMVPFFQAGRVGAGLEATVELLVAAALGQPAETAAETTSLDHLSGGAGARTEAVIGSGAPSPISPGDPGRFAPGEDPLQTLQVYRNVLRQRIKDPDLAIYTPASREFFRRWLVTDAQQANELDSLSRLLDRGEVRNVGDRAVVRPASMDLALPPYFLRRAAEGWQLDVLAMSQAIGFNHRNQWHFRTLDHPYMFAFADWSFDRHGFPRKP